jgi:OOP family OmpA-OmpF porin
VSRNFETQLAKAGFEPLLTCETDQCGGIPFTEAIDVLPIPQMWVDGFNYHYNAGKEGSANVYVRSVTSKNNDTITTQLLVSP